ncbi:MAG: glycosyltransferase family 2 protein [Armatimonadota bacterium]
MSIVIVNWNTTKLLEKLINSIEKYSSDIEHEIIVVDNNSNGFDAVDFKARYHSVQLIANRKNYGYSKANNQGLRIAVGEYVLLLNPDIEILENSIQTLINYIENHQQAACVAGKLIRPDGTIEKSLRSFPYPSSVFFDFIGLSKIFPNNRYLGKYRMTWFDYSSNIEVDQPMASCLLIRRKALDSIGLFDENFPIFFNDVDWLYRAKQWGYKVYFCADATFIHYGGSSTKQINRRKQIDISHDAMIKFYKKHFITRYGRPSVYIMCAFIWIGRYFRI